MLVPDQIHINRVRDALWQRFGGGAAVMISISCKGRLLASDWIGDVQYCMCGDLLENRIDNKSEEQ